VPVATLAEALPYVNWVTLTTLAVGAFLFAAITGQLTDATVGYLRFTVVFAGVVALLAWIADGGLPVPTQLIIKPAPADLDTIRRTALGTFVIATVIYAILLRRQRARLALALVGSALGVGVLLAAAAGWAPTSTDAVPLAVQLGSLTAVTGGSVAAVALGHWYLVTPKLGIEPLVMQSKMLLAALIVQLLLFIVWTTLGGGVNQGPWDAFTSSSTLLVVLRGVITIAFPLVLVFMGLRTAQTHSMESSTGLLYINLAAVLAGTIGAAYLYITSGILL
jgi:hypothetical protein